MEQNLEFMPIPGPLQVCVVISSPSRAHGGTARTATR